MSSRTFTGLMMVALLGLGIGAAPTAAQDKPDFSGTWKLDRARSDPRFDIPDLQIPDDPETVIIQQTATEITIDEGAGKETFRLDGSESPGRGPMGAPVVTRTVWNGKSLVTSGSFDAGQMGRVEFSNTRTLSDDGKTLFLDTWGRMEMGEGSRRIVYTKVEP